MNFRKHFPLVIALGLIFVLALMAFNGMTAVAQVDDGDVAASAGPKLWQEKEPEAYVFTPSMGDYWRSMRPPAREVVENWVLQQGKVPIDAGQAEIDAAVNAWYKNFLKHSYMGPDPLAKRKLLQREKALISGDIAAAEDQLPTPQKNPMFVVVEFDGTDTITRPYPTNPDDPLNPGPCVDTEFTWGPTFLGEIPLPGPKDNNTFFVEDPSVAKYESVVFGEGPDAPGYGIVHHPNIGPVDLTGLTATNFLQEMSHGTSKPGGGFLQETVVVDHSHEYYGYADYYEYEPGVCTSNAPGDQVGHNSRQLPVDVVNKIVETYGDTLGCSQYDADGDHIIDAFVLVHAGDGAERGCPDCIWSHSSAFLPGFDDQPQICGNDTPGDPSDDYFVQGYNQDPEPLDLGVIVEEYEHQWGLPDLYSVDGSNSNSWWGAPHTSGVWGGPLGGTRPVGHNLWQDTMLGWRNPKVINYDDPEMEILLGRNRDKPEGTEDGILIKLPDLETFIDNMAGEGKGWYSTSGDLMDNRVYRDFDLSAATGEVVFSFDAYWDIEEDWDYGYLEVSTDGGATWMTLPDMDGVLTDTDPNGNNQGWGLTGGGEANLHFDLSTYAGSTVGLRFRYLTDPAVANPGWWVDNLLLVDDSGTLYENDLENDFSDWTNEGWMVVPFTRSDEQYYLAEWWDDNGMFNPSLNDPYYTYWSSDTEWAVERMPFSTPGMVISYRNTGQDFDYEIGSDLGEGPGYGPKYGLLVVDSHFWPMRFDTHFDSFQDGLVGLTMYGRTKSGNAAFTLHDTNEKSAKLGYNLDTGRYEDPPLEEKTWPSEPGVYAFHDSMGYYPGFYYPGGGPYVYLHDWDSSAAIPARGNYSTPVTWPDGTPFEALYGIPIGPGGLGTGNPGDAGVQYGIHLEILEESEEQATVRFWNSMMELDGGITQTPSADPVMYGDTIDISVKATNIGTRMDAFAMIPFDSDVMGIKGSGWGGVFPLFAGDMAEIAAKYGVEMPVSAAATDDAPVAMGWKGVIGTGETVEFGFSVEVTSYEGVIQHSASWFDDASFIQAMTSDPIDIYDDGLRTVEIPLVADTWVKGSSTSSGLNFDTHVALVVRTSGLDNALLTFDRSALPEGMEIVNAELMINTTFESGAWGKELTVLNVNPFDSTTVTYDTAPAVYNPGESVAVPNELGMMTFDVTDNVAAWDAMGAQATTAEQMGQLAISATGPFGRVVFDSLESYLAKPAMLTVTYMLE
ncbi:MAG TPA: DNRLRE domain-containing protein [Caldilineae bacterium]|nr:DNRLRE domain-containing protein [Caldilineae bacterium]